MKNTIYYFIFILFFCSCKESFLELKPNQSIAVPTSLKDFEALLDNYSDMNTSSALVLGELSTDDYYLAEADWNQLANAFERNGYRWEPNIYEGSQCRGWNASYLTILYANVVLEGVSQIERDSKNALQWDRVKGAALFFRAWRFFQLAQIFCDDYDEQSASTKLGIPLKLTSDINETIRRATISEVYNRIVSDLEEALTHLPSVAISVTRPSKGAAYALLSRVYLQMKKYELALVTSNLYLSDFDNLVDYNNINPINDFSFPIIYNGNGITEQPLLDQMLSTRTFSYFFIDTVLLSSYDEHDLRPQVYFNHDNGHTQFVGSYNGYQSLNSFPATDEIYLIKAECLARQGEETEALNTLNILLGKRYETGTYIIKTIENTPNVLAEVIKERRKELVFRGVRWSDLRRFRTDSQFASILERKIGSTSYRLSPDQERLYTWPIPDNVIALSNIEQNPR